MKQELQQNVVSVTSKTRQLYAVINALKEGDTIEKLLNLGVEESILNTARQYVSYEKTYKKEAENDELFLIEVYTSILRRVVPFEVLWSLGFENPESYQKTQYRFKPKNEEVEYFLGLNKDLEHLFSAPLIDKALTAFYNKVVNGRKIGEYFMSFRRDIEYQHEYLEDYEVDSTVINNIRLLYTYVYKR